MSGIRLADLCSRRDDFIALRLAEANRLLRDKDLIKQSRTLLKQLDAHLAHLEILLQMRSHNTRPSPPKCAPFAPSNPSPSSPPAHMPELGSLNRRSCAALAPFNCDIGLFRGQRRTSAGRPKARHALYMAALVASRHNPILKAFYQSLLLRSKPKKLALIAVMRKLLIHLNSLLKPLASPSA